MPDILKAIRTEGFQNSDPHGYLIDLEDWSEARAQGIAVEEGIQLTAKHWEVIHFLRERYAQHGPAHYAREMVQLLESRYAHEGGRKFLYKLFPHGPVKQASHIAGLPVPSGATDRSFGSVQ